MSEAQLLEQLKDIHTYSELSNGLAWGYILLALIIMLTAMLSLWFFLKFYQRRKQKKRFQQLLADIAADEQPIKLVLLLKRFAIWRFGEKTMQPLSSRDWVNFLDKKQKLSTTIKQCLLEDIYQHSTQIDKQQKQQLAHYVSQFIRNY